MKKENVREVALHILLQIEKNQAYSNLLLNQTIQKAGLKDKDVGLLTELVYGTIQRRDTIDYYLSPFVKKGLDRLEQWVLVLLRLSLYQIVYLDRVPERAAIHEAVEIAKKKGHRGISGMVNGILRSIQREGLPLIEEIKDPINRLAIETSHPEWMIRRWCEQFGENETKKMCEMNLTPPSVTARVNRTKASVEQVMKMLQDEGLIVESGDLSEDAIKITKGSLPKTKAYEQGFVTIQDESSMLVARALSPKGNVKVLDSCAAPGGKTTHIAELLEGQGMVHSLDLHDHKVKLISQQAKRLRLENIHTKALDARKALDYFSKESFDYILVDAPCSGLGVIRRKPDVKWAKKEDDFVKIASIQQNILASVAPLLKPGGRLVYSTCTIDSIENEEVVEKFLADHPSFSLDKTLEERLPKRIDKYCKPESGMILLLPHYFGTDGFFIASLVKE
ncbi:16S rRNA (cytosine(967)-C(5))-methyltransferase RsmB [Anaerobacillus sp. MEB173]|uniref:16S rRNA (cytosine(967)-C(5))-methyltransferase RsmB n=1 Tax=Anaerobacillus sp. MEB173 TaxID=3383345 RepID=UPI003F93234F